MFQSAQWLFHGAYPILAYLFATTAVTVPLRNRLTVYMAAAGMTSIGFFFVNPNLQKLWFFYFRSLYLCRFITSFTNWENYTQFLFRIFTVGEPNQSVGIRAQGLQATPGGYRTRLT
ncbi:MAG: hypothetical protein KC592_13250 [Nitrospira sp.]|nr:hypothetical protein [Nitrospira sp.]MCW5782544.1 hypothetical protein [Nitrospirales bacterium]